MGRGWQSVFSEQRVIVTGGSSGIGLTVAQKLVAAGAHVMILARRPEPLAAALESLHTLRRDPAVMCVGHSVDVSDRRAVKNLAPDIEAFAPDLLVNNAGVTLCKAFLDADEVEIERLLRINIEGCIWLTRLVLPGMRRREQGHIAFVSSMAGKVGVYGYTYYAASKFALVGLAEALRHECSSSPIHISILYPPDTETPMLVEENRDKPAATRAVSEGVVLSAGVVAEAFLDGLARQQFEIVPDRQSRLNAWSLRHFPGIARAVLDRKIKKRTSL